MGARGMYLYSGNKDTLYRIHGTNQPEYIGQAISSGCIRMTNEDAIDLYSRVKVGTIVVVLAPKNGAVASGGQVAASECARTIAAALPAVLFSGNYGGGVRRWPEGWRPFSGIRRRASMCRISGGTPKRAGMMLVPSPPDTIMMPVVFDDVTIGKARAVLRRHELRPDERNADLAAMGVAGERQRNALRHARENVRLMDQQQHRIVGPDLAERAGQIVDAAKPGRGRCDRRVDRRVRPARIVGRPRRAAPRRFQEAGCADRRAPCVRRRASNHQS